MLLVAALLHV